MSLQHQVAEIRSLEPIRALSPIYSVQRRPWYKVYRAQCMIPFAMYSIKIVYVITFIAFRIYVRVELYLIPMVFPNAFPLQYEGFSGNIAPRPDPIPLGFYAYNCPYCANCNLGTSCKANVGVNLSDKFKFESEKLSRKQKQEKQENQKQEEKKESSNEMKMEEV